MREVVFKVIAIYFLPLSPEDTKVHEGLSGLNYILRGLRVLVLSWSCISGWKFVWLIVLYHI